MAPVLVRINLFEKIDLIFLNLLLICTALEVHVSAHAKFP
jgi:hypothetical protein